MNLPTKSFFLVVVLACTLCGHLDENDLAWGEEKKKSNVSIAYKFDASVPSIWQIACTPNKHATNKPHQEECGMLSDDVV